MFFIGSGSLLTSSVSYALKVGVKIDAVCVPIGDSSLPRLKRSNVFTLESNNPNTDVIGILDRLSDKIVFSINNKFILEDFLLTSGPTFFNIHNGLVQHYRGISEVCIFSAICAGETEYGVTLHQLLPSQKVDSGPVVAQIKFSIESTDEFFVVMKKSLQACHKIFEINIDNIVSNKYESNYVELFNTAFTYKNVARLCVETQPGKLIKATNFGAFKAFFPKLVSAVDSSRLT